MAGVRPPAGTLAACFVAMLAAGCVGLPSEDLPSGDLALSGDGARLLYSTTEGRLVVVAVPDGEVVYRSAPRTSFRPAQMSADGRMLAFEENGDLIRVEVDSADREVLRGAAPDHTWQLRADGSQVVFTTAARLTPDDEDHLSDVYLWTPGVGGVEMLTPEPFFEGRRASFVENDVLFEATTVVGLSGPIYRWDSEGGPRSWIFPGHDWNDTFFSRADRFGDRWFVESYGGDGCEGFPFLAVLDLEGNVEECFYHEDREDPHTWLLCGIDPSGESVALWQRHHAPEGVQDSYGLWEGPTGWRPLASWLGSVDAGGCAHGGGRIAFTANPGEAETGDIRIPRTVYVVSDEGRVVMRLGPPVGGVAFAGEAR